MAMGDLLNLSFTECAAAITASAALIAGIAGQAYSYLKSARAALKFDDAELIAASDNTQNLLNNTAAKVQNWNTAQATTRPNRSATPNNPFGNSGP